MTLNKQGHIVPKFGYDDDSVDEFEDLDFDDPNITPEQIAMQQFKWAVERGNDMTQEEKDAEMEAWLRQDSDWGWS